jgi:hypothetical protein
VGNEKKSIRSQSGLQAIILCIHPWLNFNSACW